VSVLLDTFITRIELLVSQMTVTGGYNSIWYALPSKGQVNDKNLQTLPCGQAIVNSETSLDDENFANAYACEAEIIIRVREDQGIKEDPIRDIRTAFYSCLEDLKKLFGKDTTLNDLGVQHFDYVGYDFVETDGKDYFTPKYMDVKFRMVYFQDRLDPSKAVC